MPVGLNNRFLLLYGSQTGQAKAIAEEIAEKAETLQLHADLHCLSETEKKFFIEREKCVVIVTSTTGDGEPPDTASKFFRRIRKKTIPEDYLSQLSYTLLGLGDSNYTNFCNCAKTLDRRLQDIGAKTFYEQGWADDAVGLEQVVEPWIENLLPAIRKVLGFSELVNTHSTSEVTPTVFGNEKILDDAESDINGVVPSTNTVIAPDVKDKCDNKIETDLEKNRQGLVFSDVTNSSDGISQPCGSINGNISQNDSNTLKPNVDLISKESLNNRIEVQTDTDSCNVNVNTAESTDMNSLSLAFQSGLTLTRELTVDKDEPSIIKSLPPLSDCALTVPILPPPYLKIEFPANTDLKMEELPLQNGASFPSAASSVVMAKVVSSVTMTTPTAVKKTQHVTLDISNTGLKYQPGDSFSLVCPNSEKEVNELLQRLGLTEQAHRPYRLTILADTKKKNASVPSHIHESSTLHHTLMTCVDIREPPKKALVRSLVEYTSDPKETRRIQELCSKQGASDYTKYIREPNLSILDILHQFPSCNPPIERILEHSPRLQPRPYSVSSSPLTSMDSLSFVFNIIDIPHGSGRSFSRKGVATGWLESIQMLQQMMDRMKIFNEIKVPVYTRTSQTFHLPDDVTTPIILIGPGTGVAPFIGFLDQLAAQRQAGNQENWGDVWLFYGCRHKSRDFLFQNKLETHLANTTLTKLLVSFSRDTDQSENSPRYVQDNIRSHGQELITLLEEKKAIVYVCGDAKNMAKDVNEAFMDVVSKERDITIDEARKYMMKLRLEKRYREDVWT